MHEMTLKLPPRVYQYIAKEAQGLGLSYSKHLLAILDHMATTQSKELMNDPTTRSTTTNCRRRMDS